MTSKRCRDTPVQNRSDRPAPVQFSGTGGRRRLAGRQHRVHSAMNHSAHKLPAHAGCVAGHWDGFGLPSAGRPGANGACMACQPCSSALPLRAAHARRVGSRQIRQALLQGPEIEHGAADQQRQCCRAAVISLPFPPAHRREIRPPNRLRQGSRISIRRCGCNAQGFGIRFGGTDIHTPIHQRRIDTDDFQRQMLHAVPPRHRFYPKPSGPSDKIARGRCITLGAPELGVSGRAETAASSSCMLDLYPGRTAMITLTGALGSFHIAQQGVHFLRWSGAVGAYGTMAGHGRKQLIDAFLQSAGCCPWLHSRTTHPAPAPRCRHRTAMPAPAASAAAHGRCRSISKPECRQTSLRLLSASSASARTDRQRQRHQ